MENLILKANQLGYRQSLSDPKLFISEFGSYMYIINNQLEPVEVAL